MERRREFKKTLRLCASAFQIIILVKKTNVMRLLDKQKIKYALFEYHYDPNNLELKKPVHDSAAVPLIYKTLVVKGDKTGIVVAVIDRDATLHLKRLAKASGNKKITLIAVKELLPTTGYIRGGCSPIGMKKPFPVFIDAQAQEEEIIYVNAGMRGLLLGLLPADLQQVANATFEYLIED